MPESSIIIPVFNQWRLTKVCLESLAATIGNRDVEIIVVDNASSDETVNACPALGATLFGDSFLYHRCEKNINFGPASNLGARLAHGEYLIFLNNDTEALPGWYEPLINDFKLFPNLAATGPLLLYPPQGMFGHTVQHLGVYISALKNVHHLYAGIPADSDLAKKRRFFQVITAACMVIPKRLFMEIGLFDEKFINGFEDVELCARLSLSGHRLSVNPEARMIHYQGRSVGRNDNEEKNARYLATTSYQRLNPDWHNFLADDSMSPGINTWGETQPMLPPRERIKLEARLTSQNLKPLILQYPYWEKGWQALHESVKNIDERAHLNMIRTNLFPGPRFALENIEEDLALGRKERLLQWDNILARYMLPFKSYVDNARYRKMTAMRNGAPEIAKLYDQWLYASEDFRLEHYNPFQERLHAVVPKLRKFIDSLNDA